MILKLHTLLDHLEYTLVKGNIDTEVSDIIYDSRKCIPNALFVCISGTTVDAHDFIPMAVEKGAKTIVVEKEDIVVEGDITVLSVENARYALAVLSAAYFGYPARELVAIGLTGTKGKTTTSYMLQHILETAGKKVGVIGTNGVVIGTEHYDIANTTPESYQVQQFFRMMADAGCEYVIMEVSSQGLMMHRVAGFHFDYAVFTNLSHDHVGPNEHASFEEYRYYKSLLFSRCKVGYVNGDDENTPFMIQDASCEIHTFGFQEDNAYRAANISLLRRQDFLGVAFDVYCDDTDSADAHGSDIMHVDLSVPGRFSIYNALAALSVARGLEIDAQVISSALSDIHVKGRVEHVPTNSNYSMIIDYAHNGVSTQSILSTLREYEPKRLVALFGCGGNRSKERRYDMGEAASKMADFCIVTADNNRFEAIEDIFADIEIGLKRGTSEYVMIPDRVDAIHYAMDHAQEGDMIVLLGKGHEEYNDVNGVKTPFSERKIIEEYRKKGCV
ncbi:MAG: UDP-N-acetylmuramoyl-L-alanyl-D-glutamate--2,6-diaminopimelate ligase [Lachnospiraceae bacterium]